MRKTASTLEWLASFLLSTLIVVVTAAQTRAQNQPAQSGLGALWITELMVNDGTSIQDEDGQFSDWIEIYNSSPNPVNLKGYHLTDDPTNLGMWTFPDVTIPGGGFRVVFASGKDRKNPVSSLHANFKLNADGEYLALVEADGKTITHEYAPQYPSQKTPKVGFSYGVAMKAQSLIEVSAEQRYFKTPTPGAVNTEGVIGFVAETQFSRKRGFYDAPFDTALSTTTGDAVIRYTTDGSVPTATHGILYAQPVHVEITTTLRASAFKPNFEPSAAITQSYIFIDQVIRQIRPPGYPARWGSTTGDYDMDPDVVNSPSYKNTIRNDLKSLPAFSLVMDIKDLFDTRTGIYANPDNKGVTWERPASTELIFPDGRQGFQVIHGVRIQGGYGRSPNLKKHSFRYLFKKEYGPGRLHFPLFSDSSVTDFDQFVLRSNYNYTWHAGESGFGSNVAHADYMRDEFARRTQLATGQLAGHGTFVHLYLNGMYWGLYNLCERPDDSFAASYYGGQKDDWDLITGGTRNINNTQVKAGNKDAWNKMMALTNAGGFENDAKYKALQDYVDIDELIDYMLVVYYIGNRDAPTVIGGGGTPWNFYSSRRRVPPGLFRFFPWDSEWSLEDNTVNVITFHNGRDNPAHIFQQLRKNPEFVMRVADHVHRHFFNGGAMTPEASIARYGDLAKLIDRAIVGESARWGDALSSTPKTRDQNWAPERDRILQKYLPARTDIVLQQLRQAKLYPALDAPEFNQPGGLVDRGFQLAMSNSASVEPIYYTTDGSDPRQPGGQLNAGKAVVYKTPIALTNNVQIKARSFDGSAWSALSEAAFSIRAAASDLALLKANLQITEVMYDPTGGTDFEFIELYNAHPSQSLSLSGLTFTEGVAFTFPDGSVLPPRSYLLVTNAGTDIQKANFRKQYGLDASILMAGPFTGKLANEGEPVTLKSASDGKTIITFEYGTSRGWPSASSGAGHSLVPQATAVDQESDGSLDYGGNWRASFAMGGSPGKADPAPTPSLLINELMANPANDGGAAGSGSWIELWNSGSASLTIKDWYLSDDTGNLKKWRLAPQTLETKQYLVIDPNSGLDSAGGNSFSLKKDGGQLYLSYLPRILGDDRVIDAVRFKAQESGITLGRFPDGGNYWYAMAPSRNAFNHVGNPHLVVDEVMYRPAVAASQKGDSTAEEFIEIFNPTDQEVLLQNENGAWRIDGGVTYVFPFDTKIPGGGRVLIVGFNPKDAKALETFRNAYASALNNSTAPILGPYQGKLSNTGERIALEKPLTHDPFTGNSSYAIVDEVIYFHQSPWTTLADGKGDSLQRISDAQSGNDPWNWVGSLPTPGRSSKPDTPVHFWKNY